MLVFLIYNEFSLLFSSPPLVASFNIKCIHHVCLIASFVQAVLMYIYFLLVNFFFFLKIIKIMNLVKPCPESN